MDDFDSEESRRRLGAWFQAHMPAATALRVVEAARMSAGHSNDTFSATIEWSEGGSPRRQTFVLRSRPRGIGLLEPYDVGKQFRVMAALAGSTVPVPRMFWLDDAGEVLGRPMFAMEKLDGVIIESEIPGYLAGAGPDKVRRMCERYVDTVAAIHKVDWRAAGLEWLGTHEDQIEHEIAWWEQEIRRHQRGPLPAIDLVIDWLRANRPAASPRTVLVHGDAKPGNVLYDDEMVRGMFDWEMTTLGDPLTDVGWLAWLWSGLSGLSSLPGALTKEEMVARYERQSGISAEGLLFYEVLAGLKMVAILFVGAMLFDAGKSDDLRYVGFGQTIPLLAAMLLQQIGAPLNTPVGETMPRHERIIEGMLNTIGGTILPELHSLVARTQALALQNVIAGSGLLPPTPAATAPQVTAEELAARTAAPR